VIFLLSTLRARAYPLAGLALLATLAGCGGGGGGEAPVAEAALLNNASASGQGSELMISEVATSYYADDIAWFEVHNPTSAPISLASYQLRSSHLDLNTRTSYYVPATFSLPAADVPPGGYLVVAARVFNSLKPNAQMVYVREGSTVPYWSSGGSIELLRNGATVDFVRFGASPAAPESGAAWAGPAVPALPAGANEHGKSIVRLLAAGMPDTNTGADWALVNFATPAGPNDVAPGVIDSDADGIPDSAKQPGGSYAGMDLYAMGARPGRRDIFVEVDYMNGSDPGLQPRAEALQKLVDAFAARNIGLHLDTGALHGETPDPARFNLGGGNSVPFASCIELVTSGAGARKGCTSFYDYKSAHFDVRRNLVFHYALFANSLKIDGGAGSSGVAELNGNDLVVALGGYGFTTNPGANLNMLINLQASTLMHELGHNLGLRHGGNEDVNYKPNHYSVMNYMYQFAGLSRTPDSIHAAERYYLANGMKGKNFCNLVENSPCSSDFRIDYSDGAGAALDENNLQEGTNIGRGAVAGAYADWDDNGVWTAQNFARNLNPQDGSARSVLRDFNEWGSLAIVFSRGRGGNNFGDMWIDSADAGIASTEEQRIQPERANPMSPHARHSVMEEALPAELQQNIRMPQMSSWNGHWKKHHDYAH